MVGEASPDFLWVKTEDQERTFWENVFYPSVLRRLGISVYPQQLVSLLAARAMDPRSFVLFPEVREVLEELKRAGVELGIISNSFPSGERILESLKLTSYFGYVFWSHQCECAKPDRGIFHQALQCASCSQACTLFVDDRPEFVKAAMQAGMDLTFWINRNGYDGNIMQQIRSLWDIIPIVRGCQKITVLWEFALLESARSTAAAKRPDAGPSPVCAR